MQRLPLSSVRTFAVVARLLSISRAAEELNVTPSAVSHHIKVLEEYLSARLFKREGNKLRLTPSGQLYMAQVSEALLLLSHATKSIKAVKGQQSIRVAASPSFAELWLVERIARFMENHHDIAIHLTAIPDPPALVQGTFDVGFWYGGGLLPDLAAESLGANCVFPVCTPGMLNGNDPLRSPADLARHTLLDSVDEAYYKQREPGQPRWHQWLGAAGAIQATSARTVNFTPRSVLHKAVMSGMGVGLTRTLLAVDALRARRLAVPFGPVIRVAPTYHLIYSPNVGRRKDVTAFRDWIHAEADTSRARIQKFLEPFTSN